MNISKNATFTWKTALINCVKTIRMESKKWTYHKEKSFSSNYFLFLMILFQFMNLLWKVDLMYQLPICHTFCKCWSFIWGCFFLWLSNWFCDGESATIGGDKHSRFRKVLRLTLKRLGGDPTCGFSQNVSSREREWSLVFCDFFQYYHMSNLPWKCHWNSSSRSEDMKICSLNINYFHQFFGNFWHFFDTKKLMTSACNRWCQYFFTFNFL